MILFQAGSMTFLNRAFPRLALITGAALGTLAAGQTGSMSVNLRVPEVCGMTADPITVTSSQNRASATFFEHCNSARGFQVFAMHRPLQGGETASVRYAGETAPLQSGGMSPIASRYGARHGNVIVEVQSDDLSNALAVSFAVTPL